MARASIPVDSDAKLLVSKANFVCNGRRYAIGEPFDRASVPAGRLATLFRNGIIRAHGIDPNAPPLKETAQLAQEPQGSVEAKPDAKTAEPAKPAVEPAQPAAAPVVLEQPPAPAEIAKTPEDAFKPQPVVGLPDYEIKKGPKGLWYQYRGGSRVSKGFLTEDDATQAPAPAADAAAVSDGA